MSSPKRGTGIGRTVTYFVVFCVPAVLIALLVKVSRRQRAPATVQKKKQETKQEVKHTKK